MTTSSATLVNRLKRLAKMRTVKQREQFLETTIEVSRRADPAVLDDLLLVIDDSTEERGLMTELWRALEAAYAPELFVPALFRTLESMLEHAPESTFYLHARILNDDDEEAFKLYMASVSAMTKRTRSKLRKMFETQDLDARHPKRLARLKRALAA